MDCEVKQSAGKVERAGAGNGISPFFLYGFFDILPIGMSEPLEAYESVLRSIGFRKRAENVWVMGIDPSRYEASEVTVTLTPEEVTLESGGESKTLNLQRHFISPQKLRREVSDVLFWVQRAMAARAARIAARIVASCRNNSLIFRRWV